MSRKIMILLILIISFSSVFFSEIIYNNLDYNVVALVNDEKVDVEVLNSRSQIIYILSDLSSVYPDFYTVLTNTATGIDLLNTYLLDQALKLTNQILFIQFVEQKGIDLKREETMNSINETFANVFKEAGIADEEIEDYLLALGYTSKANYLEDTFYSVLYDSAVAELYFNVMDQISVTEEEILQEYQSNQSKYMSSPSAELKIIQFPTSDEASFTYNRIIEGYYTFDEVFNQNKSSTSVTLNLEDSFDPLVQTIKNNPPGFIFGPVLYDKEDNSYALVKIERKYPSKQLTLEEVREQIIYNLKDNKAKEYFDEILPEEFKNFENSSTIIINASLFGL